VASTVPSTSEAEPSQIRPLSGRPTDSQVLVRFGFTQDGSSQTRSRIMSPIPGLTNEFWNKSRAEGQRTVHFLFYDVIQSPLRLTCSSGAGMLGATPPSRTYAEQAMVSTAPSTLPGSLRLGS